MCTHTPFFPPLLPPLKPYSQALIEDLKASLFPPDSREAALLTGKLSTTSNHVILQAPARGWRNTVADWLVQRGF